MFQFQKHFSVEEARALLPQLRKRIGDAHRLRDRVQKADLDLSKQASKTGQDFGGKTADRMMKDLAKMNEIVRGIQNLGIQIKDFDRGLVDFPHIRDGREVFLCWELDEDDIEFWHEIEAGYAGRERL
jgi:hypothetical protein